LENAAHNQLALACLHGISATSYWACFFIGSASSPGAPALPFHRETEILKSFTVPAGALGGGAEAITVSYRPDPTSMPVYGAETTTWAANVSASAPDAPAGLSVTSSAAGSLTATWTASIGATNYAIDR
jgi:hypothetical protein